MEKEIKNLDIYPECLYCPHESYCGTMISSAKCCRAVSDKDKERYEQRKCKG